MHSCLRAFLCQFTGVVAATLVPVVFATFVSVPMSLGAYPGDMHSLEAHVEGHLT